jgi:hypothetical protein
MRNRASILLVLALAMLAAFSFGCAGAGGETKIKCSKCGAVFLIDDGLTGGR